MALTTSLLDTDAALRLLWMIERYSKAYTCPPYTVVAHSAGVAVRHIEKLEGGSTRNDELFLRDEPTVVTLIIPDQRKMHSLLQALERHAIQRLKRWEEANGWEPLNTDAVISVCHLRAENDDSSVARHYI